MINRRQLMTGLKFLRHRWRKIHPFEVQASITNRCDHRCVYCNCPSKRIEEMNTLQWEKVIQELGFYGTLRIKFQGGEPTLRPDFPQLCIAAQQAGIIASATTNGGNIATDPSLLDHLDEIVFSLDSMNPDTHDSLRAPGSHAKLMKAIDEALIRQCRVFVNMVVCRITLPDMEDVLRFCDERRISFHAQPLYLGWKYSNKKQRNLALSDTEICAMHRSLAQWKREGRNVMFAAETYEQVVDWPDHETFTRKSAGVSSCMAGRCHIYLEPNGDVHPCSVHEADFKPRNLILNGVEDAIRHARYHNCADCWIAFLNERKALFGLRPSALKAFFHRG